MAKADQSRPIPARETLEEFDFTFERSVNKTIIEHLGQLDFLHANENVVMLGPPRTRRSNAGATSKPSSQRDA